jgi:hypothetical protein
MDDFMRERRRFLRTTAAWLVGGAAVTATRSASAWEVQKMIPTSPLGLSYANHCGGPTDHAWLVAELKAKLADDPGAQTLSAICPLCGCPVIVSR